MKILSVLAAGLLAAVGVVQAHEVKPRELMLVSVHPNLEQGSIHSLFFPDPFACEMGIWPNEIQAQKAQQQAHLDASHRRAILQGESTLALRMKHLARIGYLDPTLRQRMDAIYDELRTVYGYEFIPTEGFRSPERQDALLASGTGVTTVGAMRSCHQYGLALDSVFMVNGTPSWDMSDDRTRQAYFKLGELATRDGLQWGGLWTNPADYAHIELNSECWAAKRSAHTYFAAIDLRSPNARSSWRSLQ